MSNDLFGLLPLPWTGTVDPDVQPAGDPLLAVVLSFMKAVVNADLRNLWLRVNPAEPLPVSCTFWHNPDPTDFSTKATPAIYAWRAKSTGTRTRFSQDYTSKETPIQCLWVPPPMTQDMMQRTQPFANAIEACVRDAFVVGRHPAWKVAGDDYFNPELYGSVLLMQARCAKIDVSDFGPFELIIESFDKRPEKMSFDCLAWKLEPLELLERSPTRRYAVPQEQMQNRILLGSDPNNLLAVHSGTYDVAIKDVAPSSGDAAGGTVVTITGRQLVEGMTVLFGTMPVTHVTFVDESTITVVAPAQIAGAVDVTAIAPSGDSAVLPNAFTFV